MPDLGKYEFTVLSSYAISIALIVVLVGMSWLKSRRVKQALGEVEARMKGLQQPGDALRKQPNEADHG